MLCVVEEGTRRDSKKQKRGDASSSLSVFDYNWARGLGLGEWLYVWIGRASLGARCAITVVHRSCLSLGSTLSTIIGRSLQDSECGRNVSRVAEHCNEIPQTPSLSRRQRTRKRSRRKRTAKTIGVHRRKVPVSRDGKGGYSVCEQETACERVF